jgi:hypothetical protein
MSNKKITELTELTTPTTDDVLPLVDIATNATKKAQLGSLPISSATQTALDAKQATLVSGTNIKTINSTSLLGSGDIAISANPAGSNGQIQFNSSSAFGADSNLYWDNTNKRLGVGTSSPQNTLSVVGADNAYNLGVYGASGKLRIKAYLNTTYGTLLESKTTADALMPTTISASKILLLDGQVGVNTTSLTAQLHIKGSGSTSATTSLLVQNSSGTAALTVKDDLSTTFGNTNLTVDGSNAILFRNSLGTESIAFNLSRMVFTDLNGFVFNSATTAATLTPSSLVDIQSTTKGFLPPRMTTTQKNAISSPAEGLMVMDITTHKLCVYDGTSWVDLH